MSAMAVDLCKRGELYLAECFIDGTFVAAPITTPVTTDDPQENRKATPALRSIDDKASSVAALPKADSGQGEYSLCCRDYRRL